MATTHLGSARRRISEAGPPIVAELEGEKAKRFRAKTMLIPSPAQVEQAIALIPPGQSKTLRALRDALATESGADCTCPYTARICWQLVAEAVEEDRQAGKTDFAPWWRVTKDGKPNPKLPGGEPNHRALLLAEGVNI